jgi:hypothetical protein
MTDLAIFPGRPRSKSLRSLPGQGTGLPFASSNSSPSTSAIRNTRAAYGRAAGMFLSWCEDHRIAQRMARHSNAKTTGLYDRRAGDISVGEVERVGI